MSESRWIGDLRRHLRTGRHVIAHGNVRDLALFRGAFWRIEDVLDAVLVEEGYDRRLTYDICDGLQSPSGHADTLSEIAMRSSERAVARSRERGQSPAVLPSASTLSFESSLTVIAEWLGSETEHSAALLRFADKLFVGGPNPSEIERRRLVQFDLAIQGAHTWRDGRRNALVLLAPTLGQVPIWIYRDHPHWALLLVPKPDLRDRLVYFGTWAERFHHQAPPDGDLIHALALRTDGFCVWELEALRRASIHEQLPIDTRSTDLIDLFRFGVRDDPWSALDADRFKDAAARLSGDSARGIPARVVGQDGAIRQVVKALKTARAGLQAATGAGRPRAVLFFAGPTGVGKTETARSIAETVYQDEQALCRFDMSEYQAEHAAMRLVGAPPSYVGHDDGGQLTDRVRTRPLSVLLFDEVDKCHVRVLDLFLQVLDGGRLTDGRGETVSFRHAIVIFTSNIGAVNDDGEPLLQPEWGEEVVRSHFRRAVERWFIVRQRPELLGRIGPNNIVAFDRIRREHIRAIANRFERDLIEAAHRSHGVELSFSPEFGPWIERSVPAEGLLHSGARGIRDLFSAEVEPRLADCLLSGDVRALEVRVDGDALVVQRR